MIKNTKRVNPLPGNENKKSAWRDRAALSWQAILLASIFMITGCVPIQPKYGYPVEFARVGYLEPRMNYSKPEGHFFLAKHGAENHFRECSAQRRAYEGGEMTNALTSTLQMMAKAGIQFPLRDAEIYGWVTGKIRCIYISWEGP